MKAPKAGRRSRKACKDFVHLVICTLLAFASGLFLSGCSNESDVTPPVFIGTNYAAVYTNTSNESLPKSGTLTLAYFPDGANGSSSLVWPYLTSQEAVVFDHTIVFNGGLTEDVSWRYYPALLGYAGKGKVVDLTLPVCQEIPGWLPDWNNYFFTVLGASNHFIRLDATQQSPVYTNRPRRLEVDIDQAKVLKLINAATTNGDAHEFKGVKYLTAPGY